MPSNIRRLHPALRLNERVLGPVRHLARLAGVSPKEIIEFLLEGIFEGDVAPVVPARPRPPARVIPIARGRRWPLREVDLSKLRRHAEEARRRARLARQHAAAACDAAGSARQKAAELFAARALTLRPAPARRRW
jgi:hypothetical protein